MSHAIVALLVVLVLVLAAQLALHVRSERRTLKSAPDMLSELLKQRYVVTLRGREGDFAGILTEQQLVATSTGATELFMVFEHCTTMPTHDGDTVADIAGRVILGMSGIAYLQQVG